MSRLAAVRTLPHRAEVLLDPEMRRRAGRCGRRVVGRRAREPRVELGERREAGAPEPIDRLVVVADDHDVVGPIGRPAEHLDQLDLGDVRVLELVDQDVPELALPAAQDVGAGLEQRRDAGDLLAVVEGAAARELGLVGVEDGGELGQPEDLERGAVDDVGRLERVDARMVLGVEPRAPLGPPGAGDRATGLAVGGLRQRRPGRSAGSSPRASARSFWRTHAYAPRIERSGQRLPCAASRSTAASKLPLRSSKTRRSSATNRSNTSGPTSSSFARLMNPTNVLIAQFERRVIDERQVREDVAQEQRLADTIEHVRPSRQPGVARVLGQDPMAEAVEVRHRDAAANGRPDRGVQPIPQLARGLHVVGQEQDLLGQQVLAGLEQVPHPLDDDAGLAGPGPRDDHDRPVAPLDDTALLGVNRRGQRFAWTPSAVHVTIGFWAPCVRYARTERPR